MPIWKEGGFASDDVYSQERERMAEGAKKRKIGPFQLEKKLGVGGMGVVYLATYMETGQKAALKVLAPDTSNDPKLQKRFNREMAILKKLRHPQIVRYFGGGRIGSQHFYAMELLLGGSVEDLLKREGKLPWERVIEIGIQIAKALEHAHNLGIIHRDLKPANLFLDKSGNMKLGDFGIARDTQATALTAAGRTVGTYAYMAPEQIAGKPPVSRKTDLYALGCVLFELLTGQTPFEADTPAQMLFRHLDDVPPRVTTYAMDCPIWLENIISKLLEKDPEDRYFDALATQVALNEVGEKVAKNQSIAKATASGKTGTTRVTGKDGTELKKILGKKKKRKKRKREFVPFYERLWFLIPVLTLVIGGIVWGVWPPSSDELFARGEALMASDDLIVWEDARDKYFLPYLEKEPEGPHASQVQQYIDDIEMERAEQNALSNAKRGREPRTEAERQFMLAVRFNKFGDRTEAIRRFNGIIEIFGDDSQSRAYVNLARRNIGEIRNQVQQGDSGPIQTINAKLREADDYFAQGNRLKAEPIWQSIVSLYADNSELAQQVRYARARLQNQEVEPLNLDQPKPKSPSDGTSSATNESPISEESENEANADDNSTDTE